MNEAMLLKWVFDINGLFLKKELDSISEKHLGSNIYVTNLIKGRYLTDLEDGFVWLTEKGREFVILCYPNLS